MTKSRIHQNTHPHAVALRVAAHAFADHRPDLNEDRDPDDKVGQRLNAALLAAALDYALAVNPVCTKCGQKATP